MQTKIPMDQIFVDSGFNCRGRVNLNDCVSLAENIRTMGLLQPVVVRPRLPEDTTDKPYVLVAGFRRYAAHQINKATEIEANVRNMTLREAALANLSENVARQNLDIVQEAHAVSRLCKSGMLDQQIADTLNVSIFWVTIRLQLLTLPEDIQNEARLGRLTQHHIKQVIKIPTTEGRYEYVRKLKEHLERGEAASNVTISKQKIDPDRTRVRSGIEASKLGQYLLDTIGEGPHTYICAWFSGKISDARMFDLIKAWADAHNVPFTPPELSIIP